PRLQKDLEGFSMQLSCSSRQQLVGRYEGYSLVHHRGSFYGIPELAGSVDLTREEDCHLAGVISGETCEQVQERIERARAAVPIEFTGWLPIFETSGNCGRHPQFKHTAEPPSGYRFTYSAPPQQAGPAPWHRKMGQLLAWARRTVRRFHLLIRP